MKYFYYFLFFFFSISIAQAQEFDRPVDYLEHLNTDQRQISERLMRYISASVHAKNQGEVDRKRQQLVKAIGKVKRNVENAPGYEGDASLRNAMLKFYTLNYSVMNDDYSDIVDMKQVAEESYDAMEAYFKAQDIAYDKVNKAQDELDLAVEAFAKQYSITLVKSDDELANMLAQASEVSKYHNQIYLIVFKPFKERAPFQTAIQNNDVDALEASRARISTYVEEGLAALKGIEDFNGDGNLIAAAERRLEFYKEEADALAFSATELIKASVEVDQLSKKLEKMKPNKRTKKDVDAYNQAADKANEAVDEYNRLGAKYNQLGLLDHQMWEQVVEEFRRNHIPKYGTEEQFS